MRARVRNGRLTLDVPTDLPDGDAVDLVSFEDVLADGGDELDGEARERLHRSIARGFGDVEAGRTIDADTVLATLKTRAAST